MQAYATLFPWVAMTLASIASLACIVAGSVVGIMLATQPTTSASDRASYMYGGFATFVGSCIASMVCLWVGGKIVGAL